MSSKCCAEYIRPRFPLTKPDAIFERVGLHADETVMTEGTESTEGVDQRIAIKVVEVSVGKTHSPRMKPLVSKFVPATVGHCQCKVLFSDEIVFR